jgi:hypothetical protein
MENGQRPCAKPASVVWSCGGFAAELVPPRGGDFFRFDMDRGVLPQHRCPEFRFIDVCSSTLWSPSVLRLPLAEPNLLLQHPS